MPPTGQARSSTSQAASSISNIQLVTDALADYARITGIDLSKNPFVAGLGQSHSSEVILQLFQEREKAFKGYRDGDRRLISCLSPVVNVIQTFSGILGEEDSRVPVSPANALLAAIDTLLAAASGVTSSHDALLELFECLGNFLKHLEIYSTIPPTPVLTNVIVKIMVELLSVLALAMKQIKQGRFKKFTKKLLGEGEIEAVLQRLDRLTQDEARMTSAQILDVVHGLVGNMKIILADDMASSDSTRQDLFALQQTLYEINKAKREQLRWEVQNWLSPPHLSANRNFVRIARHEGTATWFFDSENSVLKEWQSRGSFLWIYGKPGAGKSTLLSAIVQYIEPKRELGLVTLAYYCFDFQDVKKQDCYGLLSSLVLQLSAESDSLYNILSRLYSDNSRGIRKPGIDSLRNCMTDMLSLPGQGPIYILVDALDECTNLPGRPSTRDDVLELIEELVKLNLPNLHLCVASWPEIDIRMVLEPLTSLKISLHDEIGHNKDIIEYIKSVVHSDRRMRKWREGDQHLVIDTLSQYAGGTFRWVVCQVDRLRYTSPANIRSVLKELPESLCQAYDRTLLGIDDENREYAQRLFKCLSVSIRPLCIEELAEIFAVRFDPTAAPSFNEDFPPPDAEEAVLSACSSLVTVVNREDSRVVQFSHFSVKQYLTSERLATAEERLSYYHILPEAAHTILAHISLSVLLHLDDEIDKDTIAHFPLAPYAARHWVDHAQFRNVSSHIKEVMQRLFDPAKPHFAAWVWLYDIDRYWVERMPTMHPTQPEAVPLYYSSLCGLRRLVKHLIVAHPQDVNRRGGLHTTPLHAASVKGHLDIVSLLLKSGADHNSRDDMGRVPLHLVSQGGQLVMAELSFESAQLIVNSGANVNVADDKGWTPLHAAAHCGYRKIAELLLKNGARLDVPNEDQDVPLHLACFNGKRDMALFLINHGSDINSRDKQGWIPLHAASRCGHLDVAQLLIDCGADVNARQEDRWTPLHLASRYGYLDLALLLMDYSAKVDAQQEDRWTPLHLASRYGYLGVARLLMDYGADVSAQKEDRWTALHLASGGGHFDIVKLLINRGASVDSRNDKRETPLALASWNGHLDIARFLIEKGAAVSSPDKEGDTPLHLAAIQGHLHITKFLLECGIDINILNEYGQTPLYFASGNGKLHVVRLLIYQGAKFHIGDINNSYPLHIASLNGYLDVVQLIINVGAPVDVRNGSQKTPLALASSEGKVDVGRFLIGRGADMNARDDQSCAPIHFASRCGHLDIARLLLDCGADANVLEGHLWSPIHLASANGHLKISELLIQCGASVDVSNNNQETPLYQAVTHGNAAIARLLIDHGATVHTADSNGWTLLHAASYNGHLGVLKLLLRGGADIDVINKANKTPAELASENGQTDVSQFISAYKANADTRNKLRSMTLDAVEYGADDDENDETEDSESLHAAAEEGNVDTVKLLFERGVDINARNASNQTPLHRAAAKGNVDVARLLIELGAEMDPCDNWSWTPLYSASQSGHLEVLRLLLDHGANVNARQRSCWTPAHISAANGYLEIMKLLLEHGADIHATNDEGERPYQVSLRTGNREIADLLKHGEGTGRPGESL